MEAEDGSRKLVCEKHFLDSDIWICGNMKRLVSGAVLKVWDEQHEKVHAEHDYGRTDKTKEKAEGSDDSDEVIRLFGNVDKLIPLWHTYFVLSFLLLSSNAGY